jgi:hypothetical protein
MGQKITGVKGVNTSDECDMSKLTKNIIPILITFEKRTSQTKRG